MFGMVLGSNKNQLRNHRIFLEPSNTGKHHSITCFHWLVVEPTNPFENMRKSKLDHETPNFGLKVPKIFELPPPRERVCLGEVLVVVFFFQIRFTNSQIDPPKG